MEDELDEQLAGVLQELNSLDPSQPFAVIEVNRGMVEELLLQNTGVPIVVVDYDALGGGKKKLVKQLQNKVNELRQFAGTTM